MVSFVDRVNKQTRVGSFTSQIMAGRGLFYGISISAGDKRRYFFILVDAEKQDEFDRLMASSESFDLKDYGNIIAKGTGSPSTALISEMRETYGYKPKD